MTEAELTVPKLETELESIRKWREERLAFEQNSIAELRADDGRLEERLLEIQKKLADNATAREKAERAIQQAPSEEARRSHKVLLEFLRVDYTLLKDRGVLAAEAYEKRQADLQARLDDPAVAETIREHDTFSDFEQLLFTMPASYRKVVLEHHEQVRARLAPIFELAHGPPTPLALPVCPVAAVCSLDPEIGVPTAFALIVPVSYSLYRDWAVRPQDLQSILAYTLVGAVTTLLMKAGAPNAPVAFRNYEDCLAIQVWLGNQAIEADLRKLANEEIVSACTASPELAAAGIRLHPVWVSPFAIAPDEETASPEPSASAPARVASVGARRGRAEHDEIAVEPADHGATRKAQRGDGLEAEKQ
jgi:hypothetical protein